MSNKSKIILVVLTFITLLLAATAIVVGYRLQQKKQVTPTGSEAADYPCTLWTNEWGSCYLYNANTQTCMDSDPQLCTFNAYFPEIKKDCNPGQMFVCHKYTSGPVCDNRNCGNCTADCPAGYTNVTPVGGACPGNSVRTRGKCDGCNNPYWGCCQAGETTTSTTTTSSTSTTSSSSSSSTSSSSSSTTSSTSTTSTTTTSSTSTTSSSTSSTTSSTSTSSTSTTSSSTSSTSSTTTVTLPKTGILDTSTRALILLGIVILVCGACLFLSSPQMILNKIGVSLGDIARRKDKTYFEEKTIEHINKSKFIRTKK